jgi:hypothetical protein
MSQADLRRSLERLDAQLAGTNPDDAAARASIEQVRADVQRALASADAAPAAEHHTLGEQLRAAIPEFESTHPRLTMAMAEVIDVFNRMGI